MEQYKNAVNTSKHITKTPTHYKTHTYTHPHITKPTNTHTHTLQNPYIHTPTHYKTHKYTHPHITTPPHTTHHTHTHTHTYHKNDMQLIYSFFWQMQCFWTKKIHSFMWVTTISGQRHRLWLMSEFLLSPPHPPIIIFLPLPHTHLSPYGRNPWTVSTLPLCQSSFWKLFMYIDVLLFT